MDPDPGARAAECSVLSPHTVSLLVPRPGAAPCRARQAACEHGDPAWLEFSCTLNTVDSSFVQDSFDGAEGSKGLGGGGVWGVGGL